MLTFCFLSLISCFISSHFELSTILTHSNVNTPLLYQLSATWSNHEGSLLLWCWLLSLYTNLVWFISVFLIVTSNCFLKTQFLSFNSIAELNPVLQDPVLAIHPPCIYFGYVASAVCFCICFQQALKPSSLRDSASLVQPRDYLAHKCKSRSDAFNKQNKLVGFSSVQWTHKWISLRFWLALCWCSLTIGILLGSWWAYHELGWGGWWFWDPVENASLMPWLMVTISIHTVLLPRLNYWTLLGSLCTCFLSVLGTFLVRSGLLASVHSFATDRGLILLTFCIAIALLSWAKLFFYCAKLKVEHYR